MDDEAQETNSYNSDDIDSGVSTDAFQGDPVLNQYQTAEQQAKWVAELEASRKERKDFITRGNKTIEVYADKRAEGKDGRSNYNVFFANTEIKLAALFARLGIPDIKRRFNDAEDDVSRVAANLLTRNIAYELDCGDFDTRFRQMLFDMKVPGIGVGWARFEQQGGEPVEQAVTDPVTGQELVQQAQTPITHQMADVDYVAWDDFLWAPCRTWDLCRWVARRIPMSREDVKARFGETVDANTLESLSFKKKDQPKADANKSLRPRNQTEETTDIYEIWDKDCKCVFWIAETADVPLDVQQDSNEFDGFFPSPLPPLGRFTTSNTIPVSDYSLVQDQYRELDDLNNRCAVLTRAMQLKWVFDSKNQALKDLFTATDELEGVPVNDWSAFMEKNGLAGALQFTPIEVIADTYAKLSAARDAVKAQIDQIEGISDLFRGESTPNETVLATAQKSAFGTSRLSIDQHRVARYYEQLLKLKADLICKFYTPETILTRAGVLPQSDQQYVPQAIALLKNEHMRNFRLSVSVDSLQLPNWNLDKAEKTEVFQAITGAIAQVTPVVQQQPALTPFVMQLVKFAISGYKGAQQVEGILDQALQGFMTAQQQNQNQPPKPSPEEIKAQSQAQKNQTDLAIAAMQEETKRQKAQLQAQIDTMQAQIDAAENQIQMMRAQTAAANVAQKAQGATHAAV